MKITGWSLLLFSTLMLSAPKAFAEGRCPPGQYPVASNGCAPIPGYGAGQSQQSPRVIQRTVYIDSYGAIVGEPKSGIYEIVTGKSTKDEATTAALSSCNAASGGGCVTLMWYRNSCGVLAYGGGLAITAAADTEDDAVRAARDRCKKKQAPDCEIIDVKCSIPMIPPG